MPEGRGSSTAGDELSWSSARVISNHRARQRRDLVARVLTVLCVVAVLVPLADLLYLFVYRGLQYLTLATLFNTTISPTPGLSNALAGTMILIATASMVAVPLGIFGGIYMVEFSGRGRLAESLRFSADVLAGTPSIVMGYVGYIAFVVFFGFGFSTLAAGTTLAIIMFPYVFRTTEIAIGKVPNGIREGAIALGSTKTTAINRLVLRFALPGIITGVLLAVGIGLSETAPLIYTASFSNYVPQSLTHAPVGFLTGLIYADYESPVADVQNLSYVAVFLLIAAVLLLNIVARVVLRRFSQI